MERDALEGLSLAVGFSHVSVSRTILLNPSEGALGLVQYMIPLGSQKDLVSVKNSTLNKKNERIVQFLFIHNTISRNKKVFSVLQRDGVVIN